MKNILTTALCTAVALSLLGSPSVYAVFDDFTDLEDTSNPTWTHLSGYVGSTGQTWDASTGEYRMTAPNNGLSTFGFVGSHVGPVETGDVFVAADLKAFIGSPAGGVFGIAGRLNGANGLGALTGYAYFYEPFAASGTGELVLARINPGVNVQDLGADGVENVDYVRKVTLDTNKDYTFSLSIQGFTLHGEVREVGGPLVAFQTRTDPNANPYASGTSGLLAYSQGAPGLSATDVTWDNFSSVPEPATSVLLAFGASALFVGRRQRRTG